MKFFLAIFSLVLLLVACESSPSGSATQMDPIRFVGETMGTTYSVVFLPDANQNDMDWQGFAGAMKGRIDSALVALNEEVSNWEPNSTVVQFNASTDGIPVAGATHFIENFKLAKTVSAASGGAFEPTILPLTDYWGFGSGRERIEAGVDTPLVQELTALVDISKINLEGDSFLRKADPKMKLDLGGSAKGYGTDLIAEMLQASGLKNFLVEIGGEMYASGTKATSPWTVGINLPEEGAAFTAIAETMPLQDRAVATSGNYRNYYKVGAETYSHTLNPKTGFPERNRLLSASVLAPDCATADAYATACMVLGPEAAMELIESRPDLEAYFLVRSDDGDMVPQFSSGLSLQ